jgi:hypothetical protein
MFSNIKALFSIIWVYLIADTQHIFSFYLGNLFLIFWSLGSVYGLWRLIKPPKVWFFLLHVKFPNDGYITRPYWFWAQNSVSGLEGLFSPFWPPKICYFLLHVKFPNDGFITRPYCFGPQIPFLGSEGLFSPFWSPKICFFLLHVKFLNDGYITRSCWFWAPNSVFGLWEPIFSFLTLESTYFLQSSSIYKFRSTDGSHDLFHFWAPPVPSLGIRRIPKFLG